MLEAVGAQLELLPLAHGAVAHREDAVVGLHLAPGEVVEVVDAVQEHADALDAVGDLRGHRPAVHARHLLEVGELGDLHAVQHHLPAHAPGAQGRGLPVVLLEAQVVLAQVHAHGFQALDVEVLDPGRGGLEDHLHLQVFVEAERILAIAPVGGAPGRLHVGHVPGPGSQGPEEGERIHGAGALLQIIGLADEAAAIGPEALQSEDELLDVHGDPQKEGILALVLKTSRPHRILAHCRPRIESTGRRLRASRAGTRRYRSRRPFE